MRAFRAFGDSVLGFGDNSTVSNRNIGHADFRTTEIESTREAKERGKLEDLKEWGIDIAIIVVSTLIGAAIGFLTAANQ